MTFGYIQPTFDGTEHIFNAEKQTLPEEYSYVKHLSPILDQGDKPICVPCSVSSYVNWFLNMSDGSSLDRQVCLMDIYRSKTSSGDGMQFKDALHYLRHHGVRTSLGNFTIAEYALVTNADMLKHAIVMNGVCVGGLMVRSLSNDRFWQGNQNYGGHAIAIVGYDKNGFIIRNSWGRGFGYLGYVHLPYEQFNELVETWTIL